MLINCASYNGYISLIIIYIYYIILYTCVHIYIACNIVIWDKVFKRGLSEFIKGCLPQNLVIPLLNTLSHIFFMAKRNFKSHKFHFGSHVNTLSIPWFILLIYYFFKKDFHICFGNHLRLSFGNVYWFVHAEAHEQKRDISRR